MVTYLSISELSMVVEASGRDDALGGLPTPQLVHYCKQFGLSVSAWQRTRMIVSIDAYLKDYRQQQQRQQLIAKSCPPLPGAAPEDRRDVAEESTVSTTRSTRDTSSQVSSSNPGSARGPHGPVGPPLASSSVAVPSATVDYLSVLELSTVVEAVGKDEALGRLSTPYLIRYCKEFGMSFSAWDRAGMITSIDEFLQERRQQHQESLVAKIGSSSTSARSKDPRDIDEEDAISRTTATTTTTTTTDGRPKANFPIPGHTWRDVLGPCGKGTGKVKEEVKGKGKSGQGKGKSKGFGKRGKAGKGKGNMGR